MSLPTEQHFILKENGLIYNVKMPMKPNDKDFSGDQWKEANAEREYKQALQSAIDSAVEVSNQEEVKNEILVSNPGLIGSLKTDAVYSLICSVEKKEQYWTGAVLSKNSRLPEWVDLTEDNRMFHDPLGIKTVALVTFSKPLTISEVFANIPKGKYEQHYKGEPREKETQEDQDDLWNAFGNEVNQWKLPEDGIGFHCLTQHLKKNWTLTRKK